MFTSSFIARSFRCSISTSRNISTVSMPSETSRIVKKLPASRSSAAVLSQCVLKTKILLAT